MNAHLMCDSDWKRLPDPKPIPVAVSFEIVEKAQPCCWCGEATQTGVFYPHHAPELLTCNGKGVVHEEESNEQVDALDLRPVLGEEGAEPGSLSGPQS